MNTRFQDLGKTQSGLLFRVCHIEVTRICTTTLATSRQNRLMSVVQSDINKNRSVRTLVSVIFATYAFNEAVYGEKW